jgi:hypothetical protein
VSKHLNYHHAHHDPSIPPLAAKNFLENELCDAYLHCWDISNSNKGEIVNNTADRGSANTTTEEARASNAAGRASASTTTEEASASNAAGRAGISFQR